MKEGNKSGMNIKRLLFGFCTAFVLLGAFAGVASATTWHVDDDRADYPDADFTKIQDALDAASGGDTIIVYRGTYTENVDVNKSLTIKSESGAEATIVRAANTHDRVFEVRADYVNISGFTVRGATHAWESLGVGIYLYQASGCNISDNHISNNYNGIYVWIGHQKIISSLITMYRTMGVASSWVLRAIIQS